MLRFILLLGAVVCFVVALLMALDTITGGNEEAWKVGGFLALALSFIDFPAMVTYVRRP